MTNSVFKRLMAAAEALPPSATLNIPVEWLLASRSEESDESQLSAPFAEGGVDLTLAQVASLFGKSVSTVREWCNSGQLKAYKLFGAWRVPREAIDEFQRSAKEKASSAVGRRAGKPVSLGEWRNTI